MPAYTSPHPWIMYNLASNPNASISNSTLVKYPTTRWQLYLTPTRIAILIPKNLRIDNLPISAKKTNQNISMPSSHMSVAIISKEKYQKDSHTKIYRIMEQTHKAMRLIQVKATAKGKIKKGTPLIKNCKNL